MMSSTSFINYFRKRFPTVAYLEIAGFEKSFLFWEDWFSGFFWTEEEPDKLRVQFKFTWNSEEQKFLKQAELMGLLTFHFYQKISDRLQQNSIKLLHWIDPAIRSQFLLIDEDLPSLLKTFDRIRDEHAMITETAIHSLAEIVRKYELKP